MAPGLSANTGTNLEETIAKVYETLKRTESRTLESKRKAIKTLEDSSQHLGNAKQLSLGRNSDRFSESLKYTGSKVKYEGFVLTTPHYLTMDNRVTPHKARIKQSLTKHDSNDGAKKMPVNNNKLRTIIFKTLDRLFQAPTKSSSHTLASKQKQIPQIPSKPQENFGDTSLSLETLKLLNQNTEETLPRNRDKGSPFLCRERKHSMHEDAVEAASSLDAVSDEQSSSDDDSSWEFITPLKFEEVAMEDTLELPSQNTDEKKNDLPVMPHGIKNETRGIRYQRKNSKRDSNKSKIQKKALERQCEKMRNEMLVVDEQFNADEVQTITTKACKVRPDSPVLQRKVSDKSSTKSLPNLVESIQELDTDRSPTSTISDCGTDTFQRNVFYCPSSTLSKSIPSFSEIHENDDDACSTSSSFSSLQMVQVFDTLNRSTHESTLPIPSALCNDVLVTPIDIPIVPFENEGVKTGITPKAFKELSEVFVHEKPKDNIPKAEGIDPPRQLFKEEQESSAPAPSQVNTSSDSNKSLPPPPPPLPPTGPPPPPPAPGSASKGTIRGFLHLPIFTQRQAGNCIFNEMEGIVIDERDAKKLKEKFPLKSGSKALKCLLGINKVEKLSTEEKKFLQNIEMFLRTCRVSNEKAEQVIRNIVGSILALDAKKDDIEAEWFTSLLQSLPKTDEIDKMRRNKSTLKPEKQTAAGIFVSELLSIGNLHEKLQCIQFSLDFKDGSSKLTKWAESFMAACDAIKLSDKFVLIINVIMGLLQSLNPDDQSEIYGFDIQGLMKLANRTSEDGSSTFLHFVIEYILDRPDLNSSADFYKTFKDLPDVTKTSIKEMRMQCKEWKQNLKVYKKQLEQTQRDNKVPLFELENAKKFQTDTEIKLNQLDLQLDEAQHSFDSCKERFGLMNSDTTEVIFFESLSKFVVAYQKIHDEIIAQREKANKQGNNINRRSSLAVLDQDLENVNPNVDIISRRKSCSAAEILLGEVESKKLKQPPKANPRRKSCTPREFQNILNCPGSEEIDKCLLGLLTKDDECDGGRGKRMRKRASYSPSKIPLRR